MGKFLLGDGPGWGLIEELIGTNEKSRKAQEILSKHQSQKKPEKNTSSASK